jgi:EAL domain-containing protein (putative c-di-GMP-specific phosphodiesterase class I)
MTLTASAGIATASAAGAVAAPDLMVAADVALYQAKEGGRDRFAFFSGEDRAGLEWVALVREAVDRGMLMLDAQPIVDVTTGEHYADELLVRMRGPDGRQVPAGQFVPTAERFGLIRDVDRWVVNRAVDLAASGRRVNVNISAASLADPDLTQMIGERIEAKRADPALLTFEITETVATPTIEALREFAGRIEGLGCGLSLDDVGTGFGSLTYLQNLHFTQLKIDMQFIRGILDSATDLRIVRSIVLIGQELGMRTVAEGVESADVLTKLAELGVDYAQGYHLGRAKPVGVDAA